MFTLGQKLKLKDVSGTPCEEARVIATGGGYTTVEPLNQVTDGMVYAKPGRPRLYEDATLAQALA